MKKILLLLSLSLLVACSSAQQDEAPSAEQVMMEQESMAIVVNTGSISEENIITNETEEQLPLVNRDDSVAPSLEEL